MHVCVRARERERERERENNVSTSSILQNLTKICHLQEASLCLFIYFFITEDMHPMSPRKPLMWEGSN